MMHEVAMVMCSESSQVWQPTNCHFLPPSKSPESITAYILEDKFLSSSLEGLSEIMCPLVASSNRNSLCCHADHRAFKNCFCIFTQSHNSLFDITRKSVAYDRVFSSALREVINNIKRIYYGQADHKG